jgi:hypothetical protein
MKNFLFLIAFVATLNAQIPLIGTNVAPAAGGSTIALVSGQVLSGQNSAGDSAPQSASFPSPATTSNVIIYAANGYFGAGTASFGGSDNHSNTYTQDTNHAATTDANVWSSIGHAPVTSTGSPFTVTSTPNSGLFSYPGIAAIEVSGLSSPAHDVVSSADGSGTAVTCGSLTTTAASSIIMVSLESYPATVTPGSGSGLTVDSQASPGGVAVAIAHRLVGPGTYSPTLTLSGSGVWSCTAAAYH